MSDLPEALARAFYAALRRQGEDSLGIPSWGYVGEYQEIDGQTTLDGHFDFAAAMREAVEQVKRNRDKPAPPPMAGSTAKKP